MIPDTQVTFQDEDFLAFANEEMDLGIIPFILSFREDYYQNSIIVPLESGKSRYLIPYRAIGNKIRDLQYVDSSGLVLPLRRIFVEDLHKFGGEFNGDSLSSSNKYYIENDEIVLVSRPNEHNANLKIIFYLRPNALVLEKDVSIIRDIDPITGVITLSQNVDKYSVGTLIDIVEQRSPSKILKYDVPVRSVDIPNNTITIDPALIPEHVNKDDQVSLAQTTSMPQLPAELQSLLSQRVAARCLEALGDQAGLQAANAKIAEIEQKVIPILDNRVDGSPMKVNANVGLLKSIRSYWRR
jgi:hypothetical protein